MNPTNQFHPYQPIDATPQTGVRSGGLNKILRRLGINSNRMQNIDVRQSVDKARGYAQRNPGKVLGGLAAVAIGLGLMRGRAMR